MRRRCRRARPPGPGSGGTAAPPIQGRSIAGRPARATPARAAASACTTSPYCPQSCARLLPLAAAPVSTRRRNRDRVASAGRRTDAARSSRDSPESSAGANAGPCSTRAARVSGTACHSRIACALSQSIPRPAARRDRRSASPAPRGKADRGRPCPPARSTRRNQPAGRGERPAPGARKRATGLSCRRPPRPSRTESRPGPPARVASPRADSRVARRGPRTAGAAKPAYLLGGMRAATAQW